MAIQTFVASTVLTAAQMNALQANDYNQTVSTKTASYVLVAADKGTKLVMNAGATSTTITVNTSLFSAGDTLTILNTSTSGTCTITAGTATVATAGSLALGLNQGGTLYFTSAGVSVFQANGVTAAAGGFVLTGSADPSAVASSSINNCFSATYQNYLIAVNLDTSAAATITMRMRVGGVDSTTSNSNTSYRYSQLTAVSVLDVNSNAASSIALNASAAARSFFGQINIQRPFEAQPTSGQFFSCGEAPTPDYYFTGGFVKTAATSFDGFTITPSAGTITGKIRVYGLALS